MMADRNYLIPDEEASMFLRDEVKDEVPDEALTKFVQTYTSEKTRMFSRENMTQTYRNQEGHILYVYYAPATSKDRQGVGVVNTFVNDLTELDAQVGIVITREDFTSSARDQLKEITQPVIQIFFDFMLYANPTRHNRVPEHVRLNKVERATLLKKHKIQPNQLPAMSIDDPIVQYYGWRIGDIIKIYRNNLATDKTMTQRSITFRIVTPVTFEAAKKIKAKVVSE